MLFSTTDEIPFLRLVWASQTFVYSLKVSMEPVISLLYLELSKEKIFDSVAKPQTDKARLTEHTRLSDNVRWSLV